MERQARFSRVDLPCYALSHILVLKHCTISLRLTKMKTINISDFRANLLKYLETANSGERISVTSNGKLLATITPPANQKELAKQKLQALASTAKIYDIISPTDCEWDALS